MEDEKEIIIEEFRKLLDRYQEILEKKSRKQPVPFETKCSTGDYCNVGEVIES